MLQKQITVTILIIHIETGKVKFYSPCTQIGGHGTRLGGCMTSPAPGYGLMRDPWPAWPGPGLYPAGQGWGSPSLRPTHT